MSIGSSKDNAILTISLDLKFTIRIQISVIVKYVDKFLIVSGMICCNKAIGVSLDQNSGSTSFGDDVEGEGSVEISCAYILLRKFQFDLKSFLSWGAY